MQLLQLVIWPLGILCALPWTAAAFVFYKQDRHLPALTCATVTMLVIALMVAILELLNG